MAQHLQSRFPWQFKQIITELISSIITRNKTRHALIQYVHHILQRLKDNRKIMVDDRSFPEWLSDELKERSLTQSELARQAKLSRSVIQKIVNRLVKKPDTDTCRAIAGALNLSPITVFRYAKHLPPGDEIPEMVDLEEVMSRLSTEKREEVVALARAMLTLEKQRGKSVSQ